MVRAEQLTFLILVLLIISNVNTARLPDNSLGILLKLLGKRSSNPLVVVVETPSNRHNLLRTSDGQNQEKNVPQRIDDVVDSLNEEKTLRYVADILRSTGDENDPEVIETNQKFENALRSRCEKYLECQVKCKKREKKRDKCKKTCKEVYDHLTMCGPPKKKKKDSCEDSDEFGCGKTFTIPCKGPRCGRTLPPNW